MKTIRALSIDVVSRIAAGEVIERPSSAIKELIENALDAKATQILITVVDAGLTHISVQDNGIGMSPEDLSESWKPHTTSKLVTEEDLRSVQTLGFRGEALASIASVSYLKIHSREKQKKVGRAIEVHDGKLLSSYKIGMPVGTNVIITNLFENLPARKKFLKSKQTEFRHILDVVTLFVLSHSNVGFTLVHNKKTILDAPPNESLQDRISSVLGTALVSLLLPIQVDESYVSLSGFIGKPQAASGVQKQFLFINTRAVSDPLISSAIKDAYGSLLEPTTSPIAVLFLTLPLELVDINVHPKKDRVHFTDPKLLFQTIKEAVGQTLSSYNLTFANMSWGKGKEIIPKSERAGSTKSSIANILKHEVIPWNPKDLGISKSQDILQIHNLYLITQTKQGFLIVDQHAAHERILYNQFQKALKETQDQNLVWPLTPSLLIDLPKSDVLVFEEYQTDLKSLGFDIEVFDAHSLRINSVPLFSKQNDIKALLTELIADLVNEKGLGSQDQRTHRMLSYLACKRAIKAGDVLTQPERHQLLEKLSGEDMAYTCPHGRPVKIEMNLDELHKLFKRI